MDWVWRGTAWVFGDDVQNDEGLIPTEFVRAQEYDPQVLAKHSCVQIEPHFAGEARPRDFVVAGRNFALGNPHIQGFLGLKGVGVGVLAESMPRGALRACVNAGVPVLCPSPGVSSFVRSGEILEVDFETGGIRNLSRDSELVVPALPPVMKEIVEAGGGIALMQKRLARG